MVIINQGKVSTESQVNGDGSIEEEISNKLNRTQSVKILKSEEDKEMEIKLKDNLNVDSEKDLKQVDSPRSESHKGGINEIIE